MYVADTHPPPYTRRVTPSPPPSLFQLRPFTHLDEGQVTSYLHYIAQHQPHLIPALETQYRMHPLIATLVSKLFYNSRLITDPAIAADRVASQPTASVKTLYWVDSTGSGVLNVMHVYVSTFSTAHE